MLKTTCIHPGIMRTLALCGHGDKILIADGNYPLQLKTGNAEKVYLGFSRGLPAVTDVLKALIGSVNIEKAEVMIPDGETPPVFEEFRKILSGMDLSGMKRYDFYDACCRPDVHLAISTGESRTFANILLTVGVVP